MNGKKQEVALEVLTRQVDRALTRVQPLSRYNDHLFNLKVVKERKAKLLAKHDGVIEQFVEATATAKKLRAQLEKTGLVLNRYHDDDEKPIFELGGTEMKGIVDTENKLRSTRRRKLNKLREEAELLVFKDDAGLLAELKTLQTKVMDATKSGAEEDDEDSE